MIEASDSEKEAEFHMNYFGLPQEAVDFIMAGRQFVYDPSECEAGEIKLKGIDQLKLVEVYVNSYHSPIEDKDPHAGEDGYYVVRAVDLVGECKAYGGEGILMWLPDYEVFGQWDCDHWDVMIFPEATWADIVQDPAGYLGAQWGPNFVVGEYMKPWDKCEFKLGMPF